MTETLYERVIKRCRRCAGLDHQYKGTLTDRNGKPIDDCRIVSYYDHNAGALDGTTHCNAREADHCTCQDKR